MVELINEMCEELGLTSGVLGAKEIIFILVLFLSIYGVVAFIGMCLDFGRKMIRY